MHFNKTNILFSVFGAVILIFIVLPLCKMIFSTSSSNLFETMCDRQVLNSIWLTMTSALYATILTLIFGVPLAYILARFDFIGKRVIEGIIDLPVMVPHTAAGIALLTVFGQRYFFGKMLGKLGVSVVGSQLGIVFAMSFVSAPFLINAAKEAFRLVDPKIENAARTLGATQIQAFQKITLPMSRRAIFSGMIMMWARGISEFGAVVILAYHPMVAPVLIFERFETFGLGYAKPVAVLLVLVSLGVFCVLHVFGDRKKC